MTTHDVIRSTAGHIRRVGELITDCTAKLNKRAVIHDASKWSAEEYPFFEIATPKLANLEYGSEEYKQSLRDIKPALIHHNANNSHHPEFYENGIDGMDLLDLLEMMCDWKAAGERHVTGDIIKSLEHNRERFKIGDQLYGILVNTVTRMDWVKTQRPLENRRPDGVPRRNDRTLWTKEERTLHDAHQVVELMDADVLLTDAGQHILKACDKLADYLEKDPNNGGRE